MSKKIQWTDETWNPIRGCSRVSKGCEHCYAEGVARRFAGLGQPYEGLVRLDAKGKPKAQWNGTIKLVPEHLDDPLRWRKPRHVFVNSMSDLFHEEVSFEYVAAVFGVMAAARQHTFQVLTKRPARAAAFFAWATGFRRMPEREDMPPRELCTEEAWNTLENERQQVNARLSARGPWPLPNVWLGVSVEDQATADARIPVLLTLPAAVRWVSYEPALGPVTFRGLKTGQESPSHFDALGPIGLPPYATRLDWIVVGGESGPGARPFDLAWARSTIEQCREAGVPCFVKQLGASPFQTVAGRERAAGRNPAEYPGAYGVPAALDLRLPLPLRDRKGGEVAEWPADLRVREWPEPA